MTRQSTARLTVQATLLSDPPLWCWEIVDASSGTLVESSWHSRWEAYTSPTEALRQAGPALQRLSRGAKLDRSLRSPTGANPGPDAAATDAESRAVGDGQLAPRLRGVAGIRHTR
jgi:hypothetical protein